MAIAGVLFVTAMMTALGMALDLSRGMEARSRMQNAATSASLSGAIEGGDANEAWDYFTANFPDRQGSTTYDQSDVSITIDGGNISVVPSGLVPTFFPSGSAPGARANTNSLQVTSISVAALPGSGIIPTSLMLILDRSGSMSNSEPVPCPVSGQQPCSRMQALREATFELVDGIAALPNAVQNHSVSGVPWSSNVYNPFTYSNDFRYVINQFNANLVPGGGTCGYCGWKKANEFMQDSQQKNRVIVFMTDGDFNALPAGWQDDTPNGYPPDWTGRGAPPPHRAILWKCYDAKLAYPSNLNIWTISFGGINPPGGLTQAVLEYCTSTPTNYLHVPDGQALAAVFAQVLQGIAETKIVQ